MTRITHEVVVKRAATCDLCGKRERCEYKQNTTSPWKCIPGVGETPRCWALLTRVYSESTSDWLLCDECHDAILETVNNILDERQT